MSIFNNSIWPNKDGQLGETKVAIPDGITTTWPEGDVLVGDFVFNNDGDLTGLIDSQALIANSSGSTTFPYDYVEINLPSIAEGAMTFNQGERCKYLIVDGEDITKFKYKGCKSLNDVNEIDSNYKTTDVVNGVWSERLDDLEDGNPLNGWNTGMFCNCPNLESFSSDLSSLTNGRYMFGNCSELNSFNSDLSNLTNGEYMFSHCSELNSFSADLSSLTSGNRMFIWCWHLASFPSDLSNLTDGESMFMYCTNLESFSSDLSSLTNGNLMFCNCTQLSSFSSDLPSLTEGGSMFYKCTALTAFSSDLSSLTNGNLMFYRCTNLESFSSDLSSLTNGSDMFMYCTNLESFSSDLSSLTNGCNMFSCCSNLKSFSSDMSSLTDGEYMFMNCTNLESFSSDLSNLTNGYNMFYGCKLNTASIKNIAENISYPYNRIAIHIGVDDEDHDVKETYYQQIRNKGWDVYVDVNSGSSNCCASCSSCCATCCYSLTTLDETNGEFVAPKPYWAKPVPATEDTARYIDNDGNYYNILGGDYIYVHDPETYGMFTSLEDAQAQMRLTKFTKGEEPVIIETA